MIDAGTLVAEAIQDESCLLLVLSRTRRGVETEFKKVTMRPVAVAGERKYQATWHYPDRQTFQNLDTQQAMDHFNSLFPKTFEHCHLFTGDADYAIRRQRDGSVRVKRKPPTRQPASLDHNRSKKYLIPENVPCPFLAAVGVMTPHGHVRSAMYHKFRQINRFLELIDDTIDHLPDRGTLNVVDFGCGKSYLTFALHHLLTEIHQRHVHIVGLDRNEDVVGDIRQIAKRLHCKGLVFHQGDIAGFDVDRPIHMVVSLHACDTATDAALAKAVAWKTNVILAVPCCQHELAAVIHMDELEPIHSHGILHERFAALATDALRAGVLEQCGYRTQVTEFIDMEHTAKNVLIRAFRRPEGSTNSTPHPFDALGKLKRSLGLTTTTLERLLQARLH